MFRAGSLGVNGRRAVGAEIDQPRLYGLESIIPVSPEMKAR
jgi:hypothetical protein